MAPDPWEVDTRRIPGDQPLPKLDEFGKWVREKVKTVVAPFMAQAFYSFDRAKLDAVKSQYVPKTLPGEMGCMKACYQVLGILYGNDASTKLRRDLYAQSMKQAEKVAPKEVENVIYALPGVSEVAVIGVPDPILGSAIKAVVAREPGAAVSEVDVVRHCARFLEDYMVPKFVEFRSSLPKTESGKISRASLRKARPRHRHDAALRQSNIECGHFLR